MIMLIYEHAIDSYFRRLKDKGIEESTREEMAEAKSDIVMAVIDPDKIHHEEKDRPQIHLRGDVAVVTGVKTGEEDSYGPYETLSDDIVVPTVYHRETFEKNYNDGRTKARA